MRESPASPVVLENPGYCPCCDREVVFAAHHPWFRDHYLCTRCGSLPRERALMQTLEDFFPDWRTLNIHESSPGGRGASVRLARECPGYAASHFFPDVERGASVDGIRSEDLERLTFADESIDLHVTQDVLEHVFHPDRAFRELARTLKPGGAHLFTTPLVNKQRPSQLRARRLRHGEIHHLEPPVYHGNPLSADGSLVTVDWGFDICRHVFAACGLYTQIIRIDDLDKGIRAEFVEVLITFKPGEPASLWSRVRARWRRLRAFHLHAG